MSDTETLHTITLVVNGAEHEVTVPARRLLSDALRHDLGLTGTHVGCEHGVCGCCTVTVDGLPIRSCLTFAVAVEGQDVRTVEGLAAPDGSGFLMTAAALLDRDPDPSDDEITESIAGNLCRCTGYVNISKAIRRASDLTKEAGS